MLPSLLLFFCVLLIWTVFQRVHILKKQNQSAQNSTNNVVWTVKWHFNHFVLMCREQLTFSRNCVVSVHANVCLTSRTFQVVVVVLCVWFFKNIFLLLFVSHASVCDTHTYVNAWVAHFSEVTYWFCYNDNGVQGFMKCSLWCVCVSREYFICITSNIKKNKALHILYCVCVCLWLTACMQNCHCWLSKFPLPVYHK